MSRDHIEAGRLVQKVATLRPELLRNHRQPSVAWSQGWKQQPQEPEPVRLPSKSRCRLNLMLLTGDLLSLLIFAYAGQRRHETINAEWPLLGLLWATVPFAASWLIAGWLLKAYPAGEWFSLWSFLGRSLNTWLVAALAGVLLRAYLLERAVIPTAFLSATLGFGGALLLGWRLLAALLLRNLAKQAP